MDHQSKDLDVCNFAEDGLNVNDKPWQRKASCGSVIETTELVTVEVDEDDLMDRSADSQDSTYKDGLNGSEGFNDTKDGHLEQHCPFTEASGELVIQTKEVVTAEVDEDDLMDRSADPQDLTYKDGLNGSGGFNDTKDGHLEQHCLFTEGVEPEIPSSCMSSLGLTAGNGNVSPMIQEYAFAGAVDSLDAFGIDSIPESSPSVSSSEFEDNSDTAFGVSQNHFTDDFEMDNTDTVIVHTDYSRYSGKHFPASVVLFSRDSLQMMTSTLEEKSVASSFVWSLDDILRIESQCSVMVNVAKVSIRLLSKDPVQAESAASVTGVDLVEFLVHGLDWQERIMSLNQRYQALLVVVMKNVFASSGISCDGDSVPLEEREYSDPYIPDFEEPFEEVVYPKGDKDAVSVRKSDVDLLQPDVFVNDIIIDFYVTYLKNRIPLEERQKYHFFSSFFFRKLADLDKNPSSISDGKAAFQRVRRWTRKVNIFKKDFIFIPVNYNLHWSLLVFCHLNEVACFSDENIDDSSKVPCILHMDSIRGSHAGLKDLIQSYLLEEWKERHKETAENICSKFLNLRFLSLELPQQQNCTDCGLFLLHYAELFIAEAPLNFSPFLINEFDNFLKPDWFMPAEASIKRVHIQRLIRELLARHSSEPASHSGNNISHCATLAGSNENDNSIQILSDKRNPDKDWNGNSSYTAPVQGMEMGLLGMSPCRVSQYSDHSGLGMTELIEQCQSLDQEASLVQLGFSTSTSREVEGSVNHAHSALQTELHSVDRVPDGECHGGYPSRDFDEGFLWNSNISNHEDLGDDSSQDSHFSSEDFAEDEGFFECGGGELIGCSSQNGNVDQPEKILDSSAGGYDLESSDVMETPAEDSQEMGKTFGKSDQEDLLIYSQEQVMEACQVNLGKVGDDQVVSGYETLLVEDGIVKDEAIAGLNPISDLDGDQPPKRIQPRPLTGEVNKVADEVPAGLDDGLLVDDMSSGSDNEPPAKRMQLMPSSGEEGKVADEVPAGLCDMLVVDNSSGHGQSAKRRRPMPSQAIKSKVEDETVASLDDSLQAYGSLSNPNDEQPGKRKRCTFSQGKETQLV